MTAPQNSLTPLTTDDNRTFAFRSVAVYLVIVTIVLAAGAGVASAESWFRIESGADQSPQAVVSVSTLYPILAAGQRPYNEFAVRLIAKPRQRVAVTYHVQCKKGSSEVSRSYPRTTPVATPTGATYGLRVPIQNARYCSVSLDASGKGYVKVVLFGR